MGWRGTLRQIEASNNRARRESERAERAVHREHDAALRVLERSVEAAERKIKALDDAVQRDFVKAANIRYSESRGFQLDPFRIEAEDIHLTLGYSVENTHDARRAFSPDGHIGDSWCITALDLLVSQNGLCVAVKVENSDPEYRIRLNWARKSDPASSAAFLVDPEHNEYYYPRSTDLRGEVLPNRPRIGVIVFESPRLPTSTLELHLSGVKLSSVRGAKENLVFTYRDDDLPKSIGGALQRPSLRDEVMQHVNQWASERYTQIQQQRQKMLKSSSGCAGIIVLAIGIITLAGTVQQLL